MRKGHRRLVNIILIVVIALSLVFFVVRPLTLESIIVSGISMEPTLQDGDYGLTGKLKIGGLKRFNVVAFHKVNSDKVLVKRIVGLPNENVAYHDKGLYINGEYVAEDFIDAENRSKTFEFCDFCSLAGVTLGEDEYFVLGDNRDVSIDSRDFGPIKESSIISKGIIIYGQEKNGVKNWYWPRFIGW